MSRKHERVSIVLILFLFSNIYIYIYIYIFGWSRQLNTIETFDTWDGWIGPVVYRDVFPDARYETWLLTFSTIPTRPGCQVLFLWTYDSPMTSSDAAAPGDDWKPGWAEGESGPASADSAVSRGKRPKSHKSNQYQSVLISTSRIHLWGHHPAGEVRWWIQQGAGLLGMWSHNLGWACGNSM